MQSESTTQSPRQALGPQVYGLQETSGSAGHAPDPLHNEHNPQDVVAAAYVHAPWPVQLPPQTPGTINV